jgi:hypothetical protein
MGAAVFERLSRLTERTPLARGSRLTAIDRVALKVRDVLARQLGVRAMFSNWPRQPRRLTLLASASSPGVSFRLNQNRGSGLLS